MRRRPFAKAALALVVLLAVPCFAGPVVAAAPVAAEDGVLVLTLTDAVRIAGDRNRDILSAKEFRAQVTGKYVEERASALPQVNFTSGVQRSWDGATAEAVPFTPGGTTLRFGRFDLTQPLYTWGQVEAAMRAAGIGFSSADERVRAARQATERDVTAAFQDVLLAKELSAIAFRNLEQKGRHHDEARKRLEAGTATEYDVLSAKVAVENARPDVIRSTNMIRVAKERLRFLLGIGNRQVDVSGSLESETPAIPAYEEVLASAWKRRPELADLRLRQGIAAELVKIADAGDKPRVDLKGSVGYQEIDMGPMQGSGKNWSGGIYVTWPLFDGKRTRGRVAQARSDERTLRIEEAALIDGVTLQARTAIDNLTVAEDIVRALSGTVEQAERLLSMAEKGFEFGVKTRLEVEDAQLNLIVARGGLATARRDRLVASATLRYVMGTLGEETEPSPPKGTGGKPFVPARTKGEMAMEVIEGKPELQ